MGSSEQGLFTKTITDGPTARRPNAVTSSFSPLKPCVLNSDYKYFNPSISHLEVTHIPKIVILAYFLTKL